jgi:hypothetical protein
VSRSIYGALASAALAVLVTHSPPARAEDPPSPAPAPALVKPRAEDPPSPAAAPALVKPPATTPPKKLYFYSSLDYGSESQFHPLQTSIHVAFDILRSASYHDGPFEIAYETAFANVARNLTDPFGAIDKAGGVGEFIAHEVFPFKGLSQDYGQWVPNYSLHALGEGMLYRKLSSWYEARGVPAPRFFGLMNLALAQFMNEVAENGDFSGPGTDAIADFYIFNPIGYVLFSFDPVAEFFSTTVKLSYWPDQAVLDLTAGHLLNVGSNYSFKVALPKTNVRLFYYTGANGLLGLSIPTSSSESVSFALGTRMFTMKGQYTEAGARTMIPEDLQAETGFFWDRNESLLASLIVAGPTHPRVAVNVYPGLLKFQGLTFGLYGAAGYYDGVAMGLTLGRTPLGLGFAAHERTSQEWL